MTAKEIIEHMESLRNEEQRKNLMRFFKTGPGDYGEGDEFLGLKVPQVREVVKSALAMTPAPLTIDEVPELLMSKWHEVRLCGLLILVAMFEKQSLLPTSSVANGNSLPFVEPQPHSVAALKTPVAPSRERGMKLKENDEAAIRGRDEILTMYLQYAERANNWDLVDLSAPKILGHWLMLPTNLTPTQTSPRGGDYKKLVMDELANSSCLWKQRMSIVCTWKTSQMGDPSWCLRYAEVHLHHSHDLMHKAVGWMLREMGKRCSMDLLRDFLRQRAHEMPRTMLRYAIEKMPEEERKEWMNIPMK